jgi:integrase
MRAPKPHKRAGYWYLVRRVPIAFEHLDPRRPVRVGTGIAVADDPRGIRATKVCQKLNADLEAYWRGLLAGNAVAAQERYADARRLARALGFSYVAASEIAGGDLVSLLRRVEALTDRDTVEDAAEVTAVLGGAAKPAFHLSGLLAEYEAINRASLTQMSPDQVRKWKNQKRWAADSIVEILGDKALHEITRSDMLDFRDRWQDRVVRGLVEIGTANKAIGNACKMMRTIDQTHRLGMPAIFSGLRIAGGRDGKRTAYTPEFVQSRFLAEGVFDGLNEEARRIIFLIIETGLRPSEAANLAAKSIVLDHDIPHVRIEADGRVLKTEHAARGIPLVGVALKVMQAQPEGFPRYRDNTDSLSALVGKAFRARGLKLSPGHTLYSLRHTFEDRLQKVRAPEKVIATLMGHKWYRPPYGLGPQLDETREWLMKIAFDPPASI